MPEISVIVPVYKVEPYLRRCIDSILAQTYTDFELILVDDGSPDNCDRICDEYAEKDSRIRVIHKENGGLSSARNAGISEAKGEYLCFIDSDDCVSPMYCSLLLKAAAENACQIAACSVRRFKEECELNCDNSFVTNKEFSAEKMTFDDYLKRQMSGKIEMGVWNRIYHKSIFSDIAFIEGRIHEDILFAGDLLSVEGCQVAYIDVPLYFYRQRESSIMHSQANTAKCSPDRIFAGGYLLNCAKNVGYPHLDVCLDYIIRYPWCFIDPIYVRFAFRENQAFMSGMQKLIRENRALYRTLSSLNPIIRHRILLFSHSKILYAFNAYARLIRVYFYHILKKDAYSDGHGI